MRKRRLVPLNGLRAGLPEFATPRRSAAVKAARSALASIGREARAQALTARTVWDNGTRGMPAPRLDVMGLSRDRGVPPGRLSGLSQTLAGSSGANVH